MKEGAGCPGGQRLSPGDWAGKGSRTVVGEREGEVTKGREKALAAPWGLRPFSRQLFLSIYYGPGTVLHTGRKQPSRNLCSQQGQELERIKILFIYF